MIGIGIVGCGNISRAYLELVPLFAGIEVRAVADAVPQRASGRAEAYAVRALDVADLIAAEEVDVVVNLTVPTAHYEVSAAALAAGKHVFTEKPLAVTLNEAKDLVATAKARDLRLGAAPDTFLGSAHQSARKLLDGGAIGTVTSGTAGTLSPGMEAWHPDPDFFFQPGAGPVLDVGPYYLTALVALLGPVRRVAATANSARPTRTIGSGARAGETVAVATPTNIHALIEFVSGAGFTLSLSWDVHAHRHGPMELYGTEGTMFLPDPNYFGGTVEWVDAKGRAHEEDGAEHPFARANWTTTYNTIANYRGAGLADMAAAIVTGRPHRCAPDLALHTVAIMAGILEAAETSAWVTIEDDTQRPAPLTVEDANALLRAPIAAAS